MINLQSFGDLAAMPAGTYGPKPTTLTDGQEEALLQRATLRAYFILTCDDIVQTSSRGQRLARAVARAFSFVL